MLHVGLDVHKHFSRLGVMDGGGMRVDARKVYHSDKAAIQEYFSHLPKPMAITIECTRNWYWLYELLGAYGDVALANPSKVRLIAEARTGFLPTSYIPPREVRDRRELYRYRISLVVICTEVRSRIHALLDKCRPSAKCGQPVPQNEETILLCLTQAEGVSYGKPPKS